MIQNQVELLDELFNKMNAHFFNSSLPTPLITLVRQKGAKGYFLAQSFKSKEDDQVIHEIAMNPELFNYDDKTIGSTLLHEMVHLWQEEYGQPSATHNYHNKEFALKMKEVGLQTYDLTTNEETGTRVSHKVIENGEYSKFFDTNIKSKLIYIKSESSLSTRKTKKTTSKTKYVCSSCEKTIVWGKPNQRLICGDCMEELEVKE